MQKKYIILLVILLVVSIAGAMLYITVNLGNKPTNQPSISSVTADNESLTYKQYQAMSGETYDRNFIANMIAHHQGAVDMAKLAQANAKHTELRFMADEIIAAQNQEISDMLKWQSQWGYPSTSSEDMQDHSAMGMMASMDEMTALLEGKQGDEFDKVFIEQMILHHQSAIDMAAPGETNAYRKEIKDLTRQIVSAQTKEIAQMKSWQREWGY